MTVGTEMRRQSLEIFKENSTSCGEAESGRGRECDIWDFSGFDMQKNDNTVH